MPFFLPLLLLQKTWGDSGGNRQISGNLEEPRGESHPAKDQVLLRLGNYSVREDGVFLQSAAKWGSIHLTVRARVRVYVLRNLYD